MPAHVQIHWIGVRKDSGRGAVWGWFTEIGKRNEPAPYHRQEEYPSEVACHVLWGSVGKKCHIEEHNLTYDFLQEVRARSNNFKQIEPARIVNRWGKVFDDEISMYLLMLKMKG